MEVHTRVNIVNAILPCVLKIVVMGNFMFFSHNLESI